MKRFPCVSKSFITFIFFSFIFLLIFLMMAEITLRGVGYSYSPLRIEKLGKDIQGVGKTDWRPIHSFEDSYFVFDSSLIWRPKENYNIFNAQGFRGPELSINKSEDEYRIFTIGDSNTLGPTHSLGWSGYLGQILKSSPNVKVVNAGVWGYSSWQGFKRFEEILEYKPDMVFISFGSNDALRVTISDKDYVASKRFFSSKIVQFRICQLFIALSDIVFMKNKENDMLVPRVNLDDYGDYLNSMITIAKKNNFKLILLTRPFFITGLPHHRLCWDSFAPYYNKLTMEIAEERKILGIDINLFFEDKSEYFADESHFNDEGHRLAAKIIYDKIKTLL